MSSKTSIDIIESVQKETGMSKGESERAFKAVVGTITAFLSKKNRIEIRGFGVFKTRPRKERLARNPKTGAVAKISATNVPIFRPGKQLKEAVAIQ